MSSSLLRERMALLEELGQIVNAMKNLAYAQLQRLARLREAQAEAEGVLRQALASVPAPPPAAPGQARRQLWLVIGAERGFCGGFNEQIAQAAQALRAEQPEATWLVAGARLRQRLEEDFGDAVWLPASNGSEDYASCVEQWSEALAGYAVTDAGAASLWILRHDEQELRRERLMPPAETPALPYRPPPLRYLTQAELRPALLGEHLRIQLLGAQLKSLQQENLARLTQMKRAQDHLEETRQLLRQHYFHQRQADITGELETLMSSLDRSDRGRSPPG